MLNREWEWMTPAERDAWVAVDVMGWTGVEIVHDRAGGVDPSGCFEGRVPVPAYTSDIGSAFLVLEEVGKRGSVFLSLNASANGQTKRWGVHVHLFAKAFRADGHALAESDVAAEAICRAALRAVGRSA